MRLFLIPLLIVSVVLIAGCTQNAGQTTTPTPSPGQHNTYNVAVQNFAFTPADLSIKVGDTVVWTNSDSASHTVVSDSGSEISSSSLSTGQTYSHTFSSTGTFNYHCSIHPSMKGQITVA